MILFSDVALHIYEKSGFAARPAPTLRFPSLPGDPGEGVDELFPESRAAQAWPGSRCRRTPSPSCRRRPRSTAPGAGADLLGAPGTARPTACGARIGSSAVLWSAIPGRPSDHPAVPRPGTRGGSPAHLRPAGGPRRRPALDPALEDPGGPALARDPPGGPRGPAGFGAHDPPAGSPAPGRTLALDPRALWV